MPDELVSAYDWTLALEKKMMENFDSRSQKVMHLFYSQRLISFTLSLLNLSILSCGAYWKRPKQSNDFAETSVS